MRTFFLTCIHHITVASNILMHQKCKCVSPLQCTCADEGGVTYLLGDMDLLSLEEEDENLIYTFEEWEKMAGHDPAGTIGMKPPEVNDVFVVLCLQCFAKTESQMFYLKAICLMNTFNV